MEYRISWILVDNVKLLVVIIIEWLPIVSIEPSHIIIHDCNELLDDTLNDNDGVALDDCIWLANDGLDDDGLLVCVIVIITEPDRARDNKSNDIIIDVPIKEFDFGDITPPIDGTNKSNIILEDINDCTLLPIIQWNRA